MTQPTLSPRQWAILDALAAADCHQDAANRLGMDVRAFDMALRRIRDRLGESSTFGALRATGYLRVKM